MPGSERPADASSAVIGRRIRQLRKQRGMTLRDLAGRTGLSIGFLSQAERGMSAIGLTVLGSVASALGATVADLFEPDTPAHDATTTQLPGHFTLTRADAGVTEYVSGQQTYRMLSERGIDLVLEPMVVRIAPGGSRETAYGHRGEEFAYVISGELLYEVDGIEHRLHPGDSVHLRSTVPHRMYNDTDEVTTVVSVVTPRLY